MLDYNAASVAPNVSIFRSAIRSRYGYTASNHGIYGCIAVNMPAGYFGFLFGSDAGGVAKDCVAIDCPIEGFGLDNDGAVMATIDKLSAFNCTTGSSMNQDATTNSLFYNSGGNSLSGASSYNQFYNSGSTIGSNAITTDPGVLYPVRVESGSTGYGTGSGGSNRGADVLNRYENGILTATPLWPWPNEDRIKTDMQDDFGHTGDAFRGFCINSNALDGNPMTLTRYIWE